MHIVLSERTGVPSVSGELSLSCNPRSLGQDNVIDPCKSSVLVVRGKWNFESKPRLLHKNGQHANVMILLHNNRWHE